MAKCRLDVRLGQGNLRPTLARILPHGGVALILVLIYVLGWCFLHTLHSGQFQDDAYISFRYAVNLVDGKGLVFNQGERVEGYTNFLYVMFISGLYALGIAPVLSAKLIGFLSGIGTITITCLMARRLLHQSARISFAAGALLSLSLPFVYWSLAGLETSLFGFLMAVSLYIGGHYGCLSENGCYGRFMLCSIVLALASLTRPEGY